MEKVYGLYLEAIEVLVNENSQNFLHSFVSISELPQLSALITQFLIIIEKATDGSILERCAVLIEKIFCQDVKEATLVLSAIFPGVFSKLCSVISNVKLSINIRSRSGFQATETHVRTMFRTSSWQELPVVFGSQIKIFEFGRETYSKVTRRNKNGRWNVKNLKWNTTNYATYVRNIIWWRVVDPNSIKNRNKNISNRIKNIIIGIDNSYPRIYQNLRWIVGYYTYRKGLISLIIAFFRLKIRFTR